MDVDDLKRIYGVFEDQELAPIFNKTKAAVSAWRKNGVPAAIEKIADQKRKADDIYAIPVTGTGRIVASNPAIQSRPSNAFDIPPPSGTLPVVCLAKGGLGGFFIDDYPVGQGFMQIARPYDITDRDAYAVMITGDSMYPKYEEGDIVVASPSHPLMNGKPVVVKLITEEVMVKIYRKRNGEIILESSNKDEKDKIVKPEEIIFAHRIVWKKEG